MGGADLCNLCYRVLFLTGRKYKATVMENRQDSERLVPAWVSSSDMVGGKRGEI